MRNQLTGKYLGEAWSGIPMRRGSAYLGDLWMLGSDEFVIRNVEDGTVKASRSVERAQISSAAGYSVSASQSVRRFQINDINAAGAR